MTRLAKEPAERAGIWIDQKTAFLIKVSAEHSPILEKIDSGIKSRGNSQDMEKTSIRLLQTGPYKHDKNQRHEQSELQSFFREILKQLEIVDYVYIFGPGSAKHGLNKAIQSQGSHFRCKVTGVDASDRLTENQMRQHVIEFFTSLRFEDAARNFASI